MAGRVNEDAYQSFFFGQDLQRLLRLYFLQQLFLKTQSAAQIFCTLISGLI
jgi:hypothetical protein